jgi:patatin-like phospholipase/acyl hydrolase
MKNAVRILSIDGGGIRGVIPAVLLAEIEKKTGTSIANLFDLIAGTSTGGILALLLATPKPDGSSSPRFGAEHLIEFYQMEGPRIFARSFLHRLISMGNLKQEKYPESGIELVLSEYFGECRLHQALTDLLITSYEIERRFPFFFRSSIARVREDYDFPMRDVARATSAAPTYFTPAKIDAANTNESYALIDGGVFANNPAACALVEAMTTHPEAEECVLVSLGTGSLTRSIPYAEAKSWGLARWAKPVLDIVFEGVNSTVDYQMRQLLPDQPAGTGHYYRFQTTLDEHHQALDDASPDNITALRGLGLKMAEERAQDIDELCEALLAPADVTK